MQGGYDAALGRWFGVDPQNQFASPYLAMGNNPVMMVDPDGERADNVAGLGYRRTCWGGLNRWSNADKARGFKVPWELAKILSSHTTARFHPSFFLTYCPLSGSFDY